MTLLSIHFTHLLDSFTSTWALQGVELSPLLEMASELDSTRNKRLNSRAPKHSLHMDTPQSLLLEGLPLALHGSLNRS